MRFGLTLLLLALLVRLAPALLAMLVVRKNEIPSAAAPNLALLPR
jgi:hypothetical protein